MAGVDEVGMPCMFGKRTGSGVDEVSTTLPEKKSTSVAVIDQSASEENNEMSEAEINELLEKLMDKSDEAVEKPAKPTGRWWLTVGIGDYRFRALYDTGCSCTVLGPIGLQLASAMKIKVEKYKGPPTRMANGAKERAACQITLPFTVAGMTKNLTVLVLLNLDCEGYLGSDFVIAFNAILYPKANTMTFGDKNEPMAIEFASLKAEGTSTLASVGVADVSPTEREQIQQLLDRVLPPADGKLGCTNLIKHEIDVGDVRPIKQRYYPISLKIEQEMFAQVRKMLDEDIIEPSTSGWSSPVVMVKKKNGTYRFCVDYRKVNAVSKTSAYPLPYMDAILRKLQKAKYISTLDLSQAYHQIPMEEKSKPITAFTVPGMGLFQFKRMPYGVTNGPATFQTLIDSLIGPELEPHAFSYLDDIIIVSANFQDHLKWLEIILREITNAGLTINRDKSFFCREEVTYLGVLVNRDGFRPDPARIQPILNFSRPKTLKQLQRFLGAASWYRKFIQDFATQASPLTRLTGKSIKYEWGEAEQHAFDEIKALLASAPMLHRPSPDHEFIIQTDASDTGLGAVIYQIIDGQECVIEFASRVMQKTERNYSVTERECLGVLWATEKFRCYVEGAHFTVITDHSSLKWLFNYKNPTGKLARWALKLQGYDFEIEHRKGALNVVPDALSRMYEDEEDEISFAAITAEETKDAWYNEKFEDVQNNPSKNPEYKVVGGKLYRHRPDPSLESIFDNDDDAWKLVVPADKRAAVLHECHEEPTAGHFGRHKTYQRVARYYFWPSIHRDVTRYVQYCLVCQQCKVQQLAPGGLMGHRRIKRPWEVIAADAMGPFPRTATGKKFILIFMDVFTRWIEVFTVNKANAKTINNSLRKVVLRFGAPDSMWSDQGSEFKNIEVEQACEEYGITPAPIPAYNPRADPVERVNRTYKTMMVAYIEGSHNKWDEHLDELVFAYNNAVQESLKVSPAFLNYGRHPRPPSTLRRREEQEISRNEQEEALEDWRARLEKLDELVELASKNSITAHEKQARYFNTKRRHVEFKLGDKVWRKNFVLSSRKDCIAAKLCPKFAGPYTVVGKKGRNIYILKDKNNEEQVEVIVEHLKPYRCEEEPPGEDVPIGIEEDPIEITEDKSGDCDSEASRDSRPVRSRPVTVECTKGKKRGRPRKTALNAHGRREKPALTAQQPIEEAADQRETAETREAVNQPIEGKRPRGRPKGSRGRREEPADILPGRTRSSKNYPA